MKTIKGGHRFAKRLLMSAAIMGTCFGFALGNASAQSAADAPSQDAMVNLIHLLVKQGTISKQNADILLKQAQDEAALAKQVESQKPAATVEPGVPPPPPGVIRVPYVSESTRKEIGAEVKEEVLQQARSENWAQPNALPGWIKNIEWGADFRFRDQSDFYSRNNVDEFIDFQSFNANGPFDVNAGTNLTDFPFLDTRTDRPNILSIRARLWMLAHLNDDVLIGIRLASGSDSSPVSTTQTLGGGFAKKAIWLDRAYLTMQMFPWLSSTVGRMPDPFVHTDLVYDDDLNFDGADIAMDTKGDGKHGFGVFSTLGAFPLEYVSSSFPLHDGAKGKNRTKYLLGGQIGTDWQGEHWDWKFAAAYYDFVHVQGELSQPCRIDLGLVECSSDPTRPAFMQKGNTLFLIRNIVPDPSNPTNFKQPQFVGLSFDYNILNANTSFDFGIGGHYHMVLQGDFARNMAYDPKEAFRYGQLGQPINNLPSNVPAGALKSGPNAWMLKGTLGDNDLSQPWEWNVSAGYKYIQPDAVVDAYTDSDFHLGGTNAKGYFVSASLGLFAHTWLTGRWLSASEVYGEPLAIDVFQLDLNAGL